MYKAESLPFALQDYVLPAPPKGRDRIEAIKASLGILNIGSEDIAFVLLAATYSAPILQPDYSVYVAGPTGAGKTALAALVQQHYGAKMDAKHLPCSWSSTANANELVSFYAKDSIVTIDDFCSVGSSFDVNKLHKEADRIFRSQGNKSGRSRMTSDLNMAKTFFPRGLIVSTGEDIPKGHSLRARLLTLELGPNDVDFEELTKAQIDAASGLYAASMAAYLQWLSPQYDSIQSSLRGEIARLRDKAFCSSSHRRTPDIAASLAYGFSIFLRFAQHCGAISSNESADLWNRCWRSIGRISSHQSSLQSSGDPVERFLELVRAAIESQSAYIASFSGSAPDNPETWGWKHTSYGWQSSGNRIGWIDGEDVYLQPDACFKTAQDMARNSESLSIGPSTLWKRLDERRLLKSRDANRERFTTRKTIEKKRCDVIHLDKSTLWSFEPSQPSQADESNAESAINDPSAWAEDCPVGTHDEDKVSQMSEVVSTADNPEPKSAAADRTKLERSASNNAVQWQDSEPCRCCKGTRQWKKSGEWICQTCHPGPELSPELEEHQIDKLISGFRGPALSCLLVCNNSQLIN